MSSNATAHCAACAAHDPSSRMATAAAAQYTGLAESTLRYYRHAGIGPRRYAVGTKVFYDRVDLDDWLAAQKAKSARGGVQ